jgi:hypothetical protein
MYCGECGAPTGRRSAKPVTAYLPWILSALALAAFAVAITMFLRGQAMERQAGMPLSGGVIGGEGTSPAEAPTGGGVESMPSAAELAAMSPREAADRLFDRAMRTDESGDTERAQFFAHMAVQAYDGLPPEQLDLDARFHQGLLRLVMKDPAGAAADADEILAADPDHLLGLVLSARAADAGGDEMGMVAAYERLLGALPVGLASGRQEYEMHDRLLESEAERARALTGGD